MTNKKKVRIAGLADLHVRETAKGMYQELFIQISRSADVLLLCGDITDLGLPEEAQVLSEELRTLRIPVIGVLGNHDYQNDKENQVKHILRSAGMHVLDTEAVEIEGIGFAGTKGFGGGFEKYALGSFGESGIKNFVQEVLNESLNLENQLKQIEEEKKIVVLHYSPIRQTLEGESPEIFAFLGSSRLVEPIESFEVNAVFHGHAHHGTPVGKTPKGIPVYNVAYQLMQKVNPKQPFAVIEV